MLNWRKSLTKRSVLWKLIAGFLFITIPLYTIGVSILVMSSGIVSESAKRSIEERMDYFLNFLDVEMQNVSQMLVALNNDPDIPTYLLFQGKEFSYEKVQAEKNIRTKMNIIYYSSNYLLDVFLLLPGSGKQVSFLNGSSDIGEQGKAIIERVKTSDTRLDRYADNDGITYTIVFPDVYKVNDSVDYILGVDINQNRILDGLRAIESSAFSNVFLVENENNLLIGDKALSEMDEKVYHTLKLNDGPGLSNEAVVDGVEYIVQMSSSSDGVLSLVSYVKKSDVLATVYVLKKLLWILIVCSFAFCVIYSVILVRQIHKPLNYITNSMKEVEKGNLDVTITQSAKDEFGYVFDRFNKMVTQLKTLLEEIYEKNIQLRKSELKQLQSQMNPHFLFNCFYIGYRMAKEGDNDSVANLCKYLGDYFRFITKQAQNQVQISDELKFISNYLEIQKIRFPNRLTYNIRQDEGTEAVLIPALTIQPLVENSILHGIEQIEGVGNIDISVRKTDEGISVEVFDNGVGMTESDVTDLNELIRSDDPMTESCGLWNVNHRLRTFMMSEQGIIVRTRESGGMSVSFVIRDTGVPEDLDF